MSGKREPYIFVPYFFSDFFDLSFEFFGDPATADFSVTRGSIANNDFSHWWFSENTLVATFILNKRPKQEAEKAREWIRNKTTIDQNRISDENVKLDSLVQQSGQYSNEPGQ